MRKPPSQRFPVDRFSSEDSGHRVRFSSRRRRVILASVTIYVPIQGWTEPVSAENLTGFGCFCSSMPVGWASLWKQNLSKIYQDAVGLVQIDSITSILSLLITWPTCINYNKKYKEAYFAELWEVEIGIIFILAAHIFSCEFLRYFLQALVASSILLCSIPRSSHPPQRVPFVLPRTKHDLVLVSEFQMGTPGTVVKLVIGISGSDTITNQIYEAQDTAYHSRQFVEKILYSEWSGSSKKTLQGPTQYIVLYRLWFSSSRRFATKF